MTSNTGIRFSPGRRSTTGLEEWTPPYVSIYYRGLVRLFRMIINNK